MKYYSWNVNGIRAVQGKGFLDWLESEQPDVLALQEIKARPDQLDEEMLEARGYHVAWNPATRPGYSGTATFSRRKPAKVDLGIGIDRFDDEGRITVTRHGTVDLYNVYFPNGGASDERLRYKLDFYDALLDPVNARTETGEVLRSEAGGPDQLAMTGERRALLAQALDGLDDDSREIVVLRFFERLPAREIAEIVGSTEGAVRTRLHRILKGLRAKYQGMRENM